MFSDPKERDSTMNQLPPNWVWARLGDLAEINPKCDCADDTEAGFVPLQRLGVTYRSRHTFEARPWGEIKTGYTHFRDGDVLLARITPSFENGKAGIAKGLPNGIGAGSTEYFVLRAFPGGVLPEYLLAHLKTQTFLRDGKQQMSGAVGQQRVPKQYVVDTLLPVAPLNEQRRIADKLDAILARVDACRERLDRVPVILQRFRQSVLADASSGRLTMDWRENRKGTLDARLIDFDDDSVSVPSDWPDFPLNDLLDPARPICYGVVQPGLERQGGVPLIRVQDMDACSIKTQQLRTVAPEIDEEYRRSRVQGGDLLVSVVGTIGRTAVVPAGLTANIARAIARLACRSGVSERWLNIWLTCDVLQWWLTKNAREVARKTLNLSELSSIRVALPPENEQAEIVRRVESLFAYADRLEARYQAARAQVDRLTPALLAKAFRGELLPQDPTDEPARELLSRIRGLAADRPARRGPRGRRGAWQSPGD